ICSTDAYRNEETKRLKIVLSKNGYPNHIIRKGIKEGQLLIKRCNQQKQNNSPTKKNIYFIINYYGNETLLFAEQVKKKCAKLIPNIKINFAFRKTNTLKGVFLPLQKGKDPNRTDCKIVYKIPCTNCDSIYIGETSRDKKLDYKNIKIM
ncbi:unnamed protein product, partial [Rotaria sp. Silwood2]